MTPEEFLPIARTEGVAGLRDHLRILSAADDALLEDHRAAALEWIERFLGRNITDRTVTVQEYREGRPGSPYPQTRMFPVADAKVTGPLTSRYRPESDGEGATLTETETIEPGRVKIFAEALFVEAPEGGWPAEWTDTIRELDVPVGIPAADLPRPWRQAGILLAREFYDGNAMDGGAASRAVGDLLCPWQRRYQPGRPRSAVAI